MSSGIYKITNKINGKIYIGCSKDIEYRWKSHIAGRNNRTHLIGKARRERMNNDKVTD